MRGGRLGQRNAMGLLNSFRETQLVYIEREIAAAAQLEETYRGGDRSRGGTDCRGVSSLRSGACGQRAASPLRVHLCGRSPMQVSAKRPSPIFYSCILAALCYQGLTTRSFGCGTTFLPLFVLIVLLAQCGWRSRAGSAQYFIACTSQHGSEKVGFVVDGQFGFLKGFEIASDVVPLVG